MAINYQAQLNIMSKAVRKAARSLIRDYGEICNLQTSRKSLQDFVNAAITRSERTIINELQLAKPEYSIISPKINNFNPNCAFRWVINPLDGIGNFMRAQPFFSLSIGLEKTEHGSSHIVAAVVEAPIMGESYFSEKGGGAWLEKHAETLANKHRLRVSVTEQLNKTYLAINELNQLNNHYLSVFSDNKIIVRATGAYDLALAYLAAGKLDCYVKISDEANSVANLLVLEAGGNIKINNELTIICNNDIDKEIDKILN